MISVTGIKEVLSSGEGWNALVNLLSEDANKKLFISIMEGAIWQIAHSTALNIFSNRGEITPDDEHTFFRLFFHTATYYTLALRFLSSEMQENLGETYLAYSIAEGLFYPIGPVIDLTMVLMLQLVQAAIELRRSGNDHGAITLFLASINLMLVSYTRISHAFVKGTLYLTPRME